MTARRLICNADDFGYGPRVTDGIVDAHTGGIITSTTVMTNMPAAEYAAGLMPGLPDLGVGVHLVLTCGQALSPRDQVPDLTDREGQFHPLAKQIKLLRRPSEALANQIQTEWRAQIQRAIDLGFAITHCDSHHGVHKYPVCRKVLVGLLQTFKIPAVRAAIRYRWHGQPPANGWVGWLKRLPASLGNRLNERAYRTANIALVDQYLNIDSLPGQGRGRTEQLAHAIGMLPTGTTEMAFHPGHDDPSTPDRAEYRPVRIADFNALTDPAVKEALEQHAVQAISYRELIKH